MQKQVVFLDCQHQKLKNLWIYYSWWNIHYCEAHSIPIFIKLNKKIADG